MPKKQKVKFVNGRPQFEAYLIGPKYWLTWIGMALFFLVTQFSYHLNFLLAKIIGRIFLKLGKRRREIARINLKLCFPELSEDERETLLVKNFESSIMGFFEMAMVWWWPSWRFKKLFTIEGLEHIEALNGKGAILMACHMTTLEIGPSATAQLFPVDALYRRHKNNLIDYIQARGRCSHNPDTRCIVRENSKAMIKSLREGRLVWFAPDQDQGNKYGDNSYQFAELFGIKAATLTAASRMAKMGRAEILPISQFRLENGKYLVKIHPKIENIHAEDEVAAAKILADFTEETIKEMPEQYMWMHRRFKSRPDGEASFYGSL